MLFRFQCIQNVLHAISPYNFLVIYRTLQSDRELAENLHKSAGSLSAALTPFTVIGRLNINFLNYAYHARHTTTELNIMLELVSAEKFNIILKFAVR
jgi:hypothetical protein